MSHTVTTADQPADKPLPAPAAHSPLASPGWLEFNRVKWGVTPVRMKYAKADGLGPAIDTVIYLNKQGKIFFPPRNPYSYMQFCPTPTRSPVHHLKQWVNAAQSAVEDFRRRGLANPFIVPPSVTDIRPWQWAGFKIGVRYTYVLDFPYHTAQAEGDIRTKIRKAHALGYRCERSASVRQIMLCMRATEARQGFTHLLTERDLDMLMDLMGEDQVRGYVCYAPNGEPVSADITLCGQGEQNYGWVGGTRSEYLTFGVAQLIQEFIIEDLQQSGATGLDLVGANIPSISAAKIKWGGKLVPYYTIEPDSIGYAAAKTGRTALISLARRLRITKRRG